MLHKFKEIDSHAHSSFLGVTGPGMRRFSGLSIRETAKKVNVEMAQLRMDLILPFSLTLT